MFTCSTKSFLDTDITILYCTLHGFQTYWEEKGRKMCFSVQMVLVMCFFWLSNL